MTREENRVRFPYTYEGRAGRSMRLADPRHPSGHRTFDSARYTKGRHPQESVAHYLARTGKAAQ